MKTSDNLIIYSQYIRFIFNYIKNQINIKIKHESDNLCEFCNKIMYFSINMLIINFMILFWLVNFYQQQNSR
jgi:hypothetical protein